MKKSSWKQLLLRGQLIAGLLATVAPAFAQNALPDLGEDSRPWKVDVFYENDTRFRGKDNTGDNVGLSKFRNTMQAEADKPLSNGWTFHGIFRGTYDGVYQMNKGQYGESAGGAVNMENSGGQLVGIPVMRSPTSVPYGQGAVNFNTASAIGLTTNVFGINTTTPGYIPNPSSGQGAMPLPYTPNQGLRQLFDRWTGNPNGVQVAAPVRPCNKDKRGCVDFGGYGDLTQTELEFPEFNSRLDFIREFYVKNTFQLSDGKEMFIKLGKQQVVWGRTDLFRVLDVINPMDYSRGNIYDEMQDIRIPMWILQAEYRMGASDMFQDRNFSVVWNFDKFRANNLGQCGQPNVINDAGCTLRAFKTLWDYGGTVGNFANLALPSPTPGVTSGPGNGYFLATDFGPHQIGIRNVDLPAWTLRNTQLGIKWEGVTAGGFSFSLNALSYISQLPSLHMINNGVVNMFTGAVQNTTDLIAFDMKYPRVNMIGGSADYQIPEANLAMRFEGALTHGEEFTNTAQHNGFSRNPVLRTVIGLDRPTIIPWINEKEATLISGQLFYQHIYDHELYNGAYGPVGIPDWANDVTGTLLIRASLFNARLNPQIIMARDFRAHAAAVAPSVSYRYSDNLQFSLGANLKLHANTERWAFDDQRAANPFAPFTQYPVQTGSPGSAGLAGLIPLGSFRAGPIGSAWRENEIQFTMKYTF